MAKNLLTYSAWEAAVRRVANRRGFSAHLVDYEHCFRECHEKYISTSGQFDDPEDAVAGMIDDAAAGASLHRVAPLR